MKMNLNKPFKKVTLVILLITLVSYMLIISIEKTTLASLLFGSVLLTATLMLAHADGFRGTAISVILNSTGAVLSFNHYFQTNDLLSLNHAFITLSVLISSILVGYFSEQLRENNRLLEDNLIRDSHTGLYNSKHFYSVLDEMSNFEQEYPCVSLVLIDITSLTEINKQFGYVIGDRVITDLSKLIKTQIPTEQLFFRCSGDKFALILPRFLLYQTTALVQKISESISSYRLNPNEHILIENMSITTGISNFPETIDHVGLMYQEAMKNIKNNKVFNRTNVALYRNLFENISDILGSEKEVEFSIRMFLNVIDSKDNYTVAHSERVMGYMLNFGAYLEFDIVELEKLKIMSLLHDLGKMDMPASILNKPGKLTFEEFNIIKKHTNLGFDITRCLPNLEEFAYIVKHHHERFDGKGYPDRLKGDDIPFYSRMLALADSFDAMLADRPYRKGLTYDVAIQELRDNAGTQFDPQLAEDFIQSILESTNQEIPYMPPIFQEFIQPEFIPGQAVFE